MQAEYRDVVLRLKSADGGYTVSLSRGWDANGKVLPPVVRGRASLNREKWSGLQSLHQSLIGLPPDTRTGADKVRLGNLLREVLFPGRVWTTFDDIVEHAEAAGALVRLRLLVETDDLAMYPWETVWIDAWGAFLVDRDIVSLTRLASDSVSFVPLAPAEALRVLLIGCALGDDCLPALPKVGMELRVLRRVLATLADEGLVYVEVLKNTTREDVEQALAQGWHAVFYTGHGEVVPYRDDGHLLLSDGAGGAAYWLLGELAEAVKASELTRLVVLNCCEVGQGGLAGAILSRAGVRAVLAMQFLLSDEAARRGSEAFFRALAQHLPVDEAVYCYRRHAGACEPDSAEQCTPVLYVQATDGLLFTDPARLDEGNYLRFLANRHALMPSLDPAKTGSSPSLRSDLSLSTIGHYALSPVVFMSQPIRHALDQLDLVVQSFGHPVAGAIPDVMDHWLTPPCQRPCHPLQWLLGALARSISFNSAWRAGLSYGRSNHLRQSCTQSIISRSCGKRLRHS